MHGHPANIMNIIPDGVSEGVTNAGVVGREEAGVDDVTLTVSIEHSELLIREVVMVGGLAHYN